ncbi:uncharacterized protein LOC144870173 [Branchiostoma floridae x Branchiostoma japonicum]
MEDHTVVYPEQNDGSYSDPYYKPEDRAGQESGDPYNNPETTCTDENEEEKGFGIKFGEGVMEMLKNAKSSKICWVIGGCGMLVIASVVIAVTISAYIQPGSKVSQTVTLFGEPGQFLAFFWF